MSRFVLLFIAAAAFVASCGPRSATDGSQEPTETRTDVPDSAMEETAECTNPPYGYSVRYPADWHVSTGEVVDPCSLFDPDPIDVPPASEIPIDIAMMFDVESALRHADRRRDGPP